MSGALEIRSLALVKVTSNSGYQDRALPEDENFMEVVFVRGQVLTEDQGIVDADKAEKKITQQLIHQTLERFPSIAETKGHAEKLIHPKEGDDGSLLHVL